MDQTMVYVPVRADSIFTQILETRKVVVINEAAKDRKTINEVRSTFTLDIKVNNLMIVPLGQNVGKNGGAMLLVLLNKFCFGEDDKPQQENFSISTSPATNKIFQQVFIQVLNYNQINNVVSREIVDENFVFKTMDKIMQQSSMYDFCHSIELFFADLFRCERVNVVLVHRFKKYLFRIEPDTSSGTFKMVKHDLQAGIAGFVTISAHPIITEAV